MNCIVFPWLVAARGKNRSALCVRDPEAGCQSLPLHVPEHEGHRRFQTFWCPQIIGIRAYKYIRAFFSRSSSTNPIYPKASTNWGRGPEPSIQACNRLLLRSIEPWPTRQVRDWFPLGWPGNWLGKGNLDFLSMRQTKAIRHRLAPIWLPAFFMESSLALF